MCTKDPFSGCGEWNRSFGLTIWKHRNACVFEGVAPSINFILSDIKDEHSLWCLAGAKKLEGLGLGGVI
jgi:hypothetical protein